jgi:hypothetical protein
MKSTKEIPLASVLNWHPDLKGVISDPEHRMLVRKAVGAGITVTDQGVDIVITTQDVDRDGDVILTAGVDTSFYNECLAWNHDLEIPTIGRVVDLKRGPASLTGTAIFASELEFARDIEYLVRNGFLKGVSIGFLPIPSAIVSRNHPQFMALCSKYGIDAAKCKRILTKVEMIEASIVPVGSNPHCGVISGMVSAMGKSIASKLEAKSVEPDVSPLSAEERISRLEQMLAELTTEEPEDQAPEVPAAVIAEPGPASPDGEPVPPLPAVTIEAEATAPVAEPVSEPEVEAKAVDAVASTEVPAVTAEATEPAPVEQEVKKAVTINVLRVGGPQATPEVMGKALKFVQGKPW